MVQLEGFFSSIGLVHNCSRGNFRCRQECDLGDMTVSSLPKDANCKLPIHSLEEVCCKMMLCCIESMSTAFRSLVCFIRCDVVIAL